MRADSGFAQIRSIVERSSFLHERSERRFRLAGAPGEEVSRRLDRWRGRVADGDEQRFERRLLWDGLSMEDAIGLAGGVRLNEEADLPRWADLLERVLDTMAPAAVLCDENELSELPGFAPLFTPFVNQAVEALEGLQGWTLLRQAARADLRLDLHKGLASIAEPTIDLEFSVWRALHSQIEEAAESMQRGFLSSMTGEQVRDLFAAYPVLARLLAEHTVQWFRRMREFLSRLQTDWMQLTELVSSGRAAAVARLWPSRSDRHHGGRTVVEMHLDCGSRCLYKPHALDGERAYSQILTWLNEQGIPLQFRVFKALYREQYGWVEKVESLECSGDAEVSRYFTRAGLLLALLYVLEASDCHAENVVAHGEFPVLVDMEALFHPVMGPSGLGERDDASVRASHQCFSNSVFRVGMLPRWINRNGGHENIGGLNGEPFAGRRLENLVRCGGAIQDPVKHVEEIVAGFDTMYRFLRAHADEMCASNECLRGLETLQPRFVFRNTMTYNSLLAARLKPQWMRDGFDQSVEVDVLCRRFLFLEERPPVWLLCNREKQSLLNGDIPRFLVPGSAHPPGSQREGLESFTFGLDAAVAHLHNLPEEELTLQTAYIRLAFGSIEPPDASARPARKAESDLLTKAAMEEEVLAIGSLIRSLAVTAPDGSMTWITRAYQQETPIWQLRPMTASLYDGLAGTALFFAALEKVLPGCGYGKRAEDTFWRIADSSRSSEIRRFMRDAGLGAGTGVPSVAYALSKAATFLGNRGLALAADEIASAIGESEIGTARPCDLMLGVAGCLAVLILLYEERGDARLLALARKCGDRLLERRFPKGEGFPHGDSGIAYALMRLSTVSGLHRYGEEALELWDAVAQRADVCPEAPASLVPRTSWCHGNAGRLLVDLRSGAGTHERVDLMPDLRALAAEPLSGLDHPCCGNLGRIDALLEGADRFRDESLTGMAWSVASKVVRRARVNGRYGLGTPKGFQLASFHQGLAGIGYQLLRLIAPADLPSVLLWE